MIKILEHSIIEHNLSMIRDKNTSSDIFRSSISRLSYFLAIESFKDLQMKDIDVETPIEKTFGKIVNTDVVVVAILRAGLMMISAFQEIYPLLKTGYIGLKRDETTLRASEYYFNVPEISKDTKVVILDPMLATGGSACWALKRLENIGAKDLTLAVIIATPEGIQNVNASFPSVKIVTIKVDRGLNNMGYIVPGLGDAGDRANG